MVAVGELVVEWSATEKATINDFFAIAFKLMTDCYEIQLVKDLQDKIALVK